MNYYEAREIQKDGEGTGLFHFTKMNDGQVWPVGYCAEGCPGHDTTKEAESHYHQYLLDHRLELHLNDPSTQKRCQICDVWTTGYARFGQVEVFHLCDEHQTRDAVETLTSPASSITSSW